MLNDLEKFQVYEMKRIDCKIVNFILSIVMLLGSVACTGGTGTGEPGGQTAIVTDVQAEATMLLTAGGDYVSWQRVQSRPILS